jgi:pilus biogenesis lipoprotein CpaD
MKPRNSTAAIRLMTLGGLLLVTGCEAGAPTATGWSDPVVPKQNKVEFVTLDHDVYFPRGTKALTAAETAGLSGFLRANAIAEGDTVTVEAPAGLPSSVAAARQAAVLSALRHLDVRAVSADAAASTADPGVVRIHVGHAVVTAPRCPDWSKPEPDNPANSPSSNFGCATEVGLAQMVADPADLVRGREGGTADGAVLARGVELYRSGKLAKTLSPTDGSNSGGAPAAPGAGGGDQ